MATLNEIFEQKIPERITNNPDKVKGIDAVYEFNITGEGGGIWSLDLTGGKKEVVTGSTGRARCTITMAADDFVQMVSGNLNPQMAFMGGKLKVAGDMGLALKLGNILG
jgi:putative sterol carrier protein